MKNPISLYKDYGQVFAFFPKLHVEETVNILYVFNVRRICYFITLRLAFKFIRVISQHKNLWLKKNFKCVYACKLSINRLIIVYVKC